MKVKTENLESYGGNSEAQIIAQAKDILKGRLLNAPVLNNADTVGGYLMLENHKTDKERFLLLSLDSQLKLISCDVISEGTVKDAYVHPRDVVTMALKRNASACIISHNHPSGSLNPSGADNSLTKKLKYALESIDINMLDHVITAGSGFYSYAEMGIMPTFKI